MASRRVRGLAVVGLFFRPRDRVLRAVGAISLALTAVADAPVARVCTAEVPIPYPRHLEEAAVPQVDDIVAAARLVTGRG